MPGFSLNRIFIQQKNTTWYSLEASIRLKYNAVYCFSMYTAPALKICLKYLDHFSFQLYTMSEGLCHFLMQKTNELKTMNIILSTCAY